MGIGSLGSALQMATVRDLIGEALSNAIYGKWTIVPNLAQKEQKKAAKSPLEKLQNTVSTFVDNAIENFQGNSIQSFDSFVEFKFEQTTTATKFPVEGINGEEGRIGGFTNISKFSNPKHFEVILAKSGFSINYQMENFLKAIDKLVNSADLVDISTPFRSYKGINLTSYSYRHAANEHANMLFIHLSGNEILQPTTGVKAGKVSDIASKIQGGKAEVTDAQQLQGRLSSIGGGGASL